MVYLFIFYKAQWGNVYWRCDKRLFIGNWNTRSQVWGTLKLFVQIICLHVLRSVYLILFIFCSLFSFLQISAGLQNKLCLPLSWVKPKWPTHTRFDIKWNESSLRGRVPKYQCRWKYWSIQNEVPKPFFWVLLWISADCTSAMWVSWSSHLVLQRTTGGGFKMQGFLLWDGFGRAGSSEAAPVLWLQKPCSLSGTRWGCSFPGGVIRCCHTALH